MQPFCFIVLTAPQVILCISRVEADCQCLPFFLYLWRRAVPWALPTPLSSHSLLCPGTGPSADSCPLPGLRTGWRWVRRFRLPGCSTSNQGPLLQEEDSLGCGDAWNHSHSLLWQVRGLGFLLQTNPFCFPSFRDSSIVSGPRMAPSLVFLHRHETRG